MYTSLLFICKCLHQGVLSFMSAFFCLDRTPLHYAAASRHFQCLETLVSCGTCINATDQWGRSVLHYAAASDLDRRYNKHLDRQPRPKSHTVLWLYVLIWIPTYWLLKQYVLHEMSGSRMNTFWTYCTLIYCHVTRILFELLLKNSNLYVGVDKSII